MVHHLHDVAPGAERGTLLTTNTMLDQDGGLADLHALAEVEHRTLWLSTAMIHHANRVRTNTSGLKVGGHQASCASMATIMTALWFTALRPGDRVSVKPHASPVPWTACL